ncbi:MAG: hypothetical protein FH749_04285 [Firmicutes bacterium]|nr:hypothetical protein [Bacillota bacterium]
MLKRFLGVTVSLLLLFTMVGCKGYEGSTDTVNSVQLTDDGGYILAGDTVYRNQGREALIIKTDADGNVEWRLNFAGLGLAIARDVQQADDGGYIVVGTTQLSEASNNDVLLAKVDAQGDKEWFQTYGGDGADYAYSVQQTPDGGYVLAGSTNSLGTGNTDAWLIKTDAGGEEEWSQTYGGPERDYASSLHISPDGGYILAGTATKDSVNGWLVKTDVRGNKEWDQSYGGDENDYILSMQATADGGYVLAGSSWSLGDDYSAGWLVKTDAQGNEEWGQSFGGNAGDVFTDVRQTRDGGYIISGDTRSYATEDAYVVGWLVKTDAGGNEEWSRTFEEPLLSFIYAVRELPGDGYILVGTDHSTSLATSYLLKVDPQGDVEWFQTFEGAAGVADTILLLALLLTVLLFSALYFLTYYRDMEQRGERKLIWLLKFLFLGPIAAAWYKVYRKQEAETDQGSNIYRLAKGFLLPWSLYVLALPALLFGIIVLFDTSVGVEHIGESAFWGVVVYMLYILPFWVLSLIVPIAVMMFSRGPKKTKL